MMRANSSKTVVAGVVVSLGLTSAALADQEAKFLSCLDSGVSKLVTSQESNYSSPQFSISCRYNKPAKRERIVTFTFVPPEGFRIANAEVEIVEKAARTGFRDLEIQPQSAKITLHCKGSPESKQSHYILGLRLVGTLEYQPNVDDMKTIAGACLSKL